jgi:hypothetical protein
MICLPVRRHLLSGQTFCVNICLNIGLAGADFCPSRRLASSFACTPDSVRRDFGPMRHDLADSASTFAEPMIGQAKVFTGSRT